MEEKTFKCRLYAEKGKQFAPKGKILIEFHIQRHFRINILKMAIIVERKLYKIE
jgi:hypothetical protein